MTWVRRLLLTTTLLALGWPALRGDDAKKETVPDQVSYYSPALKHGVFTHALLEALDGKADANGDGIVTLAEVDAYVGARVAELGRPNLATKVVLGFKGVKVTPQTPTLSKPATIPSNMPMAVVAPAAPASHPIGS